MAGLKGASTTPRSGGSNGCGCGCPPCNSCYYEAETAQEDAPRLGPVCLVCGGPWGTCPHDEFHVIDQLRAALAKAEAAEAVCRDLADSRLRELSRASSERREYWIRAEAAEAKLDVAENNARLADRARKATEAKLAEVEKELARVKAHKGMTPLGPGWWSPEQAAKAVEALEKYGEHHETCTQSVGTLLNGGDDDRPCSCGYDAARAAIRPGAGS